MSYVSQASVWTRPSSTVTKVRLVTLANSSMSGFVPTRGCQRTLIFSVEPMLALIFVSFAPAATATVSAISFGLSSID